MNLKSIAATSAAALIFAASTSLAMAQATATENNATSMPHSDMKGSSGEMKGMSGAASSGSMEMKSNKPTSAGTEQNPVKDLRGHSETPTTGTAAAPR